MCFVPDLYFKPGVGEQKVYLQQPWSSADRCKIQANLSHPCFLPGPKEKNKNVIYHQMYTHRDHKHIWLPQCLENVSHKPLEGSEIENICLQMLAFHRQTVHQTRVVSPINCQRVLTSVKWELSHITVWGCFPLGAQWPWAGHCVCCQDKGSPSSVSHWGQHCWTIRPDEIHKREKVVFKNEQKI